MDPAEIACVNEQGRGSSEVCDGVAVCGRHGSHFFQHPKEAEGVLSARGAELVPKREEVFKRSGASILKAAAFAEHREGLAWGTCAEQKKGTCALAKARKDSVAGGGETVRPGADQGEVVVHDPS